MNNVLKSLASPSRITQFISVGVVGALLETIIVLSLTNYGSTTPLVAKAIGAETSISFMFIINDNYTFSEVGMDSIPETVRRWMKSHLVRAGGLTVAFLILWLLTARTSIQLVIGGANLWPTTANLIGIGVGLSLNYIAESLFTWRVASKA